MKLIQWIIKIVLIFIFYGFPGLYILIKIPNDIHIIIVFFAVLIILNALWHYTSNHIIKSFDKWFESKLK